MTAATEDGEDGMADMFNACLAFTLREEGGYVDDPADPGGATNMGITLATYREWSDDPTFGPTQVEDMTERTARAIYRSLYWNPLRADALPTGVDLSVFDMGVNAGIWRSARLLQRALGFTGEEVDGCIGPETLDAAAKCDPCTLVTDLAERQSAYYRSLADFPIFGTGWLNRTEARRVAALAMISGAEKLTG
jgi:lysozyme family protein